MTIQSISYFFGALFGLAFGSFLGVLVERGCSSPPPPRNLRHSRVTLSSRKPAGRVIRDLFKLLSGRSHCSSCHHQLSWWENIPLISFIFLKGKCHVCRSPIPYWLPLIELAGAAAGAAIAAQIDQISPIGLIGLICIAAALIWIFFSDLIYSLIPDWAVVLGCIGVLISNFKFQISNLEAALTAAFFFWFLVKITRGRGMGTGDITLAFFLGLWLGWPLILPALWLAFVIGAAFGGALIIFKKKNLKSALPFGPFMILGSLLSLRWGQQILGLINP